MRKLLGVAMIALLAMTYTASPDAVRTGMGGVSALGKDVWRAAVGAAGDGTATPPGEIVTLPDGSTALVPPGFKVDNGVTP